MLKSTAGNLCFGGDCLGDGVVFGSIERSGDFIVVGGFEDVLCMFFGDGASCPWLFLEAWTMFLKRFLTGEGDLPACGGGRRFLLAECSRNKWLHVPTDPRLCLSLSVGFLGG